MSLVVVADVNDTPSLLTDISDIYQFQQVRCKKDKKIKEYKIKYKERKKTDKVINGLLGTKKQYMC